MITIAKYPKGKSTDFFDSIKGFFVVLLLTFTVSISHAQTTADWYVDVNAGSGGTGDSWAQAFNNLQTAINASFDEDIIFVKKGEYILSATISVKDDLSIYGSFSGSEATLEDRDLSNFSNDPSNATILKSNGSQGVISMNNPPVPTVPSTLDGLVITGGNTDDGAGIYNNNASPILRNLIITGNTANSSGGGIFNANASPVLINVAIIGNSSAVRAGGMYNYNSLPNLTNVTISGNDAPAGGGIYLINASNAQFNNTIIFDNTANTGPNIIVDNSTPVTQFSIVEGFKVGSSDLDGNAYSAAELFADPDNGDYTLKNTSPLVNAGSNALYTNAGGDLTSDTDAAGGQRLYDGVLDTDVIDLGAYELQREIIAPISPDANNILYVNKDVSGGDESGDSWENAIPELADALVRTRAYYNNSWETTPLKMYVATGTYKPLYSPEDGEKFGTDQGRNNSFSMIKNVQLYGGFDPANGIDDLTDTRILPSAEETAGTVLSGDIGTQNEISDNAYNVLVSAGDVGSASLDGFTITGGYADAYLDIYVNGKQIFKCSGAGVYNSVSSPNYKNIILQNNSCTESGGGMFSYMSSPKLQLVIMKNNQAKDGGGMTNQESSSPTLLNVSIQSNNASEKGSGMYNVDQSDPTLTNVSIVGNEASVNSEEFPDCVSENSTIILNNSIIWDAISGDYTAQNCLIKGSSDTENGNIDATSLTDTDIFTDPANGDFRLKAMSAAIDAGSNTLYTDAGGDLANDVDLAGNPRLYDAIADTDHIDLGAYENADPEFTSATTASLVENTTETTYTAVALGAGVISYSLGTGHDEALFNIVAATGVVTFKAAPDFENPSDSDTDNAYVIQVIATERGNSANQEVTISVTDADEIAPTVTISSTTTAPVSEAFDVTITFSEAVTGFAIADLALTNAEASDFSGTGDTYSVTLTPLASGTVTVDIAAGSATDAANNDNSAGTFSIEATVAVALSVENNLGTQLLIYPNPSSQYIRIESSRSVVSYSLLDINGRLLKQIAATDQAISIGDLEAGIYFIHARGERSTMTKFIKN